MLSREYPSLYIDGGWQEPDSKERFDVISPATGEKIGYVPAANNDRHRSRRRGRAQGVLRDGLADAAGRASARR